MSRFGALLVHGFSGSSRDLTPLARGLTERFGAGTVYNLVLPGHGEGQVPGRFEREALLAAVAEQLEDLRRQAERLLVVGHSTGGSLLLTALDASGVAPDLTVLAAVPYRIDLAYLERWQKHRAGKTAFDLTTVAALVAQINASGYRGPVRSAPVLLLQGEDDQLVTREEALRWQEKLTGETRCVFIPQGEHQLFTGRGRELAVETVVQAVDALLASADAERKHFAGQLVQAEPEAAAFLTDHPSGLAALADSPSGRRLAGRSEHLPEVVPWQPVFANIEITTRCNLECRYCARAFVQPAATDLALADFARILERLPAAYRITLVGLGEPLLHAQVVALVALAKASGRRVGLVTNAQLLTAALAAELLAAGLDSIAFSLDSADTATLARLRPGSELAQIETNIRAFNALAETLPRPVARAVFTAVSAESLAGLERLIELVSTLGVHVMMLSDLNFAQNQAAGLSTRVDAALEAGIRQAVARGFALKLPILGVRSLEDFGLAAHYRASLLVPPRQLYRRSPAHAHCLSPWQTVAVNVAGGVSLCDCQPTRVIGNLLEQDLATIWNGDALRRHRRSMRADDVPAACRICPRF